MISITNPSTGEVVSLSMIAEEGNLWKMGQAHDQQDNLSITLTSSTKGNIIQDRGYSGFSERQNQKFHRFIYHNVLAPAKSNVILSGNDNTIDALLEIDAQSDNRSMEYDDIVNRYIALSGDIPGFPYKLLSLIVEKKEYLNRYSGGNIYNFRLEGGDAAELKDTCISMPDKKGFVNAAGFNEDFIPRIENDRTILYFGGSFWVVDRPNKEGMVWLMNSPIAKKIPLSWNPSDSMIDWSESVKLITENEGLRLYGMLEKKLGYENLMLKEYSNIPQNGNIALENYTYGFRDINAQSYVMQYPIMGADFVKYVESCPRNCQCFRKNLNNEIFILIVPPKNTSIDICQVLGNECAMENLFTDGIFTATFKNGEWNWNHVDGEVYEYVGMRSVGIGARGGTTNRQSYVLRMKSGETIEGKYKSSYLPAIPLLLLR